MKIGLQPKWLIAIAATIVVVVVGGVLLFRGETPGPKGPTTPGAPAAAQQDKAVQPAADATTPGRPGLPGKPAIDHAQGRNPAGQVTGVRGQVNAAFRGNSRPLAMGDIVYPEDRILTGQKARLVLKMLDNAIIALGEDTEFLVEKYDYARDNPASSGLLNLSKGFLRFTSGGLGKLKDRPFKVHTPTATMGIRGTKAAANPSNIYSLEGVVTAQGNNESTPRDIPAGSKVSVDASGTTSQPHPTPAQEAAAVVMATAVPKKLSPSAANKLENQLAQKLVDQGLAKNLGQAKQMLSPETVQKMVEKAEWEATQQAVEQSLEAASDLDVALSESIPEAQETALIEEVTQEVATQVQEAAVANPSAAVADLLSTAVERITPPVAPEPPQSQRPQPESILGDSAAAGQAAAAATGETTPATASTTQIAPENDLDGPLTGDNAAGLAGEGAPTPETVDADRPTPEAIDDPKPEFEDSTTPPEETVDATTAAATPDDVKDTAATQAQEETTSQATGAQPAATIAGSQALGQAITDTGGGTSSGTTSGSSGTSSGTSTPKDPITFSLDNSSVSERALDGSVIGTFSATSLPASTTVVYTLVASTTGVNPFSVSDNQLMVANSALLAGGATHEVTIRATSGGYATTTKTFTITVMDDFSPTGADVPTSTLRDEARTTYEGVLASLAKAKFGDVVVLNERQLLSLLVGKVAQQLTSTDVTQVMRKVELTLEAPDSVTLTMEIGLLNTLFNRLPATVQANAETLFNAIQNYATDYTANVRLRLRTQVTGQTITFVPGESFVDLQHASTFIPSFSFSLASLITEYNDNIGTIQQQGGLTFFTGGGNNLSYYTLARITQDADQAAQIYANQPAQTQEFAGANATSQTVPVTQKIDYYLPGLVSSLAIQDGGLAITR